MESVGRLLAAQQEASLLRVVLHAWLHLPSQGEFTSELVSSQLTANAALSQLDTVSSEARRDEAEFERELAILREELSARDKAYQELADTSRRLTDDTAKAAQVHLELARREADSAKLAQSCSQRAERRRHAAMESVGRLLAAQQQGVVLLRCLLSWRQAAECSREDLAQEISLNLVSQAALAQVDKLEGQLREVLHAAQVPAVAPLPKRLTRRTTAELQPLEGALVRGRNGWLTRLSLQCWRLASTEASAGRAADAAWTAKEAMLGAAMAELRRVEGQREEARLAAAQAARQTSCLQAVLAASILTESGGPPPFSPDQPAAQYPGTWQPAEDWALDTQVPARESEAVHQAASPLGGAASLPVRSFEAAAAHRHASRRVAEELIAARLQQLLVAVFFAWKLDAVTEQHTAALTEAKAASHILSEFVGQAETAVGNAEKFSQHAAEATQIIASQKSHIDRLQEEVETSNEKLKTVVENELEFQRTTDERMKRIRTAGVGYGVRALERRLRSLKSFAFRRMNFDSVTVVSSERDGEELRVAIVGSLRKLAEQKKLLLDSGLCDRERSEVQAAARQDELHVVSDLQQLWRRQQPVVSSRAERDAPDSPVSPRIARELIVDLVTEAVGYFFHDHTVDNPIPESPVVRLGDLAARPEEVWGSLEDTNEAGGDSVAEGLVHNLCTMLCRSLADGTRHISEELADSYLDEAINRIRDS